jgi:hypothetical protein
VIAHPGHELRVHGWLERARPLVFVLTDGSGSTGISRVESTRRVIEAAGASPGPVFGRLSDRRVYECLVEGAVSVFTALADEIATCLAAEEIEVVVSDAREGYNSGHDICRSLAQAAVQTAGAIRGTYLSSFDFLVMGSCSSCAHPDAYPEMASEVNAAIGRLGIDAFRVECLRPVRGDPHAAAGGEKPYYERYGEQQVEAGLYKDVVRARQHVDPMVSALRQHALRRSACRGSSSS